MGNNGANIFAPSLFFELAKFTEFSINSKPTPLPCFTLLKVHKTGVLKMFKKTICFSCIHKSSWHGGCF